MLRFKKTSILLFVLLVFLVAVSLWAAAWMRTGSIPPSGGFWWFGSQSLPVPHFAQADPRWGSDALAATPGSLAAEGCAVASAAMVMAAYGADTDPGRLNAFLREYEGGFTPEGWIYWEAAAQIDPALGETILPHYEDAPSFALIDLNLLRGNPVIARLRYPGGITHFVVIVGKQGFDYLILDPGRAYERGVYPLKDFG